MVAHLACSVAPQCPMHATRPVDERAHEQLLCAATRVAPPCERIDVMLGAAVKGRRLAPKSWPCSPRPQARARPPSVSASVWSRPHAQSTTRLPARSPSTRTGVRLQTAPSFQSVLWPSCSHLSQPKVQRTPVVSAIALWFSPAETTAPKTPAGSRTRLGS
eukprot:3943338-Prymnesium_polylepis.1